MSEPRKSVLFVCTHNSARSQMAEGLLRHFCGAAWEAASAGTEATFVKPAAIETMLEIGIDISGQRSKTLEELRGRRFDVVVTLCDSAREACPYIPGGELIHRSFPDPATPEEFRAVRDGIRAWIIERFGGGAA